jgi:hypothetical protein
LATVERWLARLGLNRRRWLDVDASQCVTRAGSWPKTAAHMVHLDVTKVGRIRDGGGWRI